MNNQNGIAQIYYNAKNINLQKIPHLLIVVRAEFFGQKLLAEDLNLEPSG